MLIQHPEIFDELVAELERAEAYGPAVSREPVRGQSGPVGAEHPRDDDSDSERTIDINQNNLLIAFHSIPSYIKALK